MDILNERDGVQKERKGEGEKDLPPAPSLSLKRLVTRACISPLLEENQPSKQPNGSYCVCFQFSSLSSFSQHHKQNRRRRRRRRRNGRQKYLVAKIKYAYLIIYVFTEDPLFWRV